MLTAWSLLARTIDTSPSDKARTSVWAHRWRGWKARLPSTRCFVGCRTCALACRWNLCAGGPVQFYADWRPCPCECKQSGTTLAMWLGLSPDYRNNRSRGVLAGYLSGNPSSQALLPSSTGGTITRGLECSGQISCNESCKPGLKAEKPGRNPAATVSEGIRGWPLYQRA